MIRTFARGRHGALFGVSLACAAVLATASFLNVEERRDLFEISVWLGGSLFFLLLSMAALFRRHVRVAFWLALPAALSGLVGVAAYLLAYNGFADALAHAGFLLIETTDAHMSGSLALLIAATSILLASTAHRHGLGRESLASAGFVVALLVLTVWVGQSLHLVPLEAGVLAQPLLLAEGAALLFVAGLLIVACFLVDADDFGLRNRFLPMLAFAVLLAASFHLWLVLVGQEQLTVQQQTQTTSERLSSSLEDHMRDRMLALQRLAGRMTSKEVLNREAWQDDAKNHLSDFSSLSAIGWITRDGYVHWAVSRESDEYRIGELYAVDESRQRALEQSRALDRLAFSAPLPLRAGGFGQIVALPLQRNDRFDGWLVVGVRFAQLFSAEVGSVAPGFAVRVIEGEQVIFERIRDDDQDPLARTVTDDVDVPGLEWQLVIWPEQAFFADRFLWLPGFMLSLGVLASLMFAIALYQLQVQRRRTASLRASEERYRLTAIQTGEIIYDYHIPSGRIEWAGAIGEVTGESIDAFSNVDIHGWMARLHPDDAEYVLPLFEDAERALKRFLCEYRFRRGDGSYVRVEDRGVFLAGPDGKAERMLGTISDVSQRYEFEYQLRYLAHFDQQTGLRNRVWFMEDAVRQAELAEREESSLWCVFMDVDRFRAVNETLGHVVGDLLLEAVARRMEAVIGERGELARLAGDEFGLCIRASVMDREAMMAFCEELTREFKQPLRAAGHSLFVTLSAGVAGFPDDGENIQEVIRAAETAMFRAKHRGRNTYAFYEQAMSAGARENLEIATALRRALDHEEFHLVFQPRYSLATGRVTGMEALLRWESPELGPVSPAVFIPIAEETGLIGPLGWYVVDAAAAAARRLGPDVMLGRRLAINVSARQLVYTDFVPELVRRIEAAGAVPRWFELELTESLMMEDPRRARDLILKLHEHGFTVSIDDFGTGYSSLSYLKHFPFDNLKIDRSFVTGLPESKDDAAIVRTIVSMGQGLGLKLIAEGIETDAQSDFLKEAGCQEAQGFLFARPMSLAQLSVLLD